MSEASATLLTWIEHQGYWAPLLFIVIHLLRPFLFLPVILLCIAGGVLFGPVAGTAYSVVGTVLSSILFYRMTHLVPSGFKRLQEMYKKWTKRKSQLTVKQVAILRLIPFIHFHFLSYCLIQITADFKDYTKSSLVTNFPLAFIYTSMGQWITLFSLPVMLFASSLLLLLCFIVRKKSEVFLWNDFFQTAK
ncbi:TVP38/TMEM64 family protein [Halobacillus sp. Marseille-Q1614]|uniref:TVP38/TMEM64 family protein n=1 Tax=Halobacillus sp. Marseille-Q1614 TaxID=2709134 RepID=UPI00156E5098|nr:VTT domain-containing protein [Halobacillus sp. Marseille-Q1614]